MEAFYRNYYREKTKLPITHLNFYLIMKKFLFFAIMLFMGVFANAQSFSDIDAVKKANNAFFAIDKNGKQIGISHFEYLTLKEEGVKNFVIVRYAGVSEDKSFEIVIPNTSYTTELLVVDSITTLVDGFIVNFSNQTTYKTQNKNWVKVLAGQKVLHTIIQDSQRNFEKYETLVAEPLNFVAHQGLGTQQRPSFVERAKEKVEQAVDEFISPTVPRKGQISKLQGGLTIISE